MAPGEVDEEWNVLKIIILMNIAVFVLQTFSPSFYLWTLGSEVLQVKPGAALSWEGLKSGKIYQLVTHMFVHAGAFHILANMFVVYIVGRTVMMVLGERRFLILYLTGGVVGGLAQLPFTVDGGFLVGASGAAFALLLAFTTILWNQRIVLLLFFIIPVVAKAKNIAIGIVAASIVMMFLDLFGITNTPVGHWAHLGGAVTGYIFAKWLGYGRDVPVLNSFEERMKERFASRPKFPMTKRGGGPVLDAEILSEERGSRPKPRKRSRDEARIDAILDKIYARGIDSLTAEERKILEESGRGV